MASFNTCPSTIGGAAAAGVQPANAGTNVLQEGAVRIEGADEQYRGGRFPRVGPPCTHLSNPEAEAEKGQ